MAAGVGDPERWTEHKFGLSDSQWVRLCGRVVVVTGAGTGLGQALAIALATAHARVVLCGRRRDRLDETLVTMRRLGSDVTDCVCLPLDVRISSAVEHAIDRINSSCGAIYGLVNNAALPPPNAGRWPLADANPADWQAQLDTNVTGSWLMTRFVLRSEPSDSVRIVFVTSAAGWSFNAGVGPYNVSKAALNSLSGSFAQECADGFPGRDIQINAFDPGEMRSEMNGASSISPFLAVPVLLRLLAQAPGGPTGMYFRRDGTSVGFGITQPYEGDLVSG